MATNIGPKIGIEGERQYKAEMANIIQQAKTLDSEMKLVTSSFAANTTAEEKNAKTAKIAAEQQDNQRRKVELLEQMLQKSAEVYGENDTKTLKWKESLNKAATELNIMEREGKEASGEAKNLAKNMDKTDTETKTYAKDAGKATDQTQALGKSFDTGGEKGLKFGDIIKANILSDAIKAGFKELANIAGKLAEGFKAAVQGSAEYADNIITMSQVTGIATDKLQAYQYMANLTDTSVETITGAMTKLTRNMNSARSGTKATAEAFGLLGVEITKSDGTLRDNDEVFGEIIDKLGAMEEGAERDAIAMQIFGKSAQDLNPLIKQGSEGIAELTKEAEKVGAVLSEKDLATLGGIQDSFDRLAATGDALKNRLGVALGEIILPQLDEFAELMQMIAGGEVTLEEAGKRLGQILGELVEKAAEALPDFLNFGMGIIENLAVGILAALPSVASELPKVLVKLVEFILSALPKVLNAAAVIVVELAKGIAQALPELIPAAVDAVLQLVETLIDNIDLIIDAGIDLLLGLTEGILGAVPQLLARLPEIIVKLINTLMSQIPDIIRAGVKILTSLVSAMPEIINGIVQALPVLISGLIGGLYSHLPEIIDAGVELLVAIVSNLPQIIKTVVGALPDIVSAIVKGIGDAWPQIKKAGADLFKGLWEGIKSVGDWLWRKVKGLLSGLTDKIKGFFGIHSPSKLFEDEIGVNLAKGIGVGFADEMPSITADMTAAMPRALNASTTNMGGVTITVNGAPGQDVGQLADLVAVKIQNMVKQKEAVFA